MFQQRKNKRYGYTPRFDKNNGDEGGRQFEDKWQEVRDSSIRKRKRGWSLKVLLLILILLVAAMYYIEKVYL